jgi:agmatine deiminase
MMRKYLTILMAAVVLFVTGCGTQPAKEIVQETSIEFVFPEEWAEHEGTWLIWPHNYGVIEPEYVDMIDDLWITMTEALHTGEKVHIIVYNEEEQTRVSNLLTEAAVDLEQIDFLISESDQFWAGDCGPMFVFDADGATAI